MERNARFGEKWGLWARLEIHRHPTNAGSFAEAEGDDIPGPFVYVSFRVDCTPQFGEFIVTTPDEARALVWPGPNCYDSIEVYNNLSAACFDALIDESSSQHIPIIGHRGIFQTSRNDAS